MATRTAKNKDTAPRMTAHHYEFLAHVLANEVRFRSIIATTAAPHRTPTYEEVVRLAEVFARALKATNPRFDADTFTDAVKEKL